MASALPAGPITQQPRAKQKNTHTHTDTQTARQCTHSRVHKQMSVSMFLDTCGLICRCTCARTHTLTPTFTTPNSHLQPASRPLQTPTLHSCPLSPTHHPFLPSSEPSPDTQSFVHTLLCTHIQKKKTYLGGKHMNMCWSKKRSQHKAGSECTVFGVLTHIHSHTYRKTVTRYQNTARLLFFYSVSSLQQITAQETHKVMCALVNPNSHLRSTGKYHQCV